MDAVDVKNRYESKILAIDGVIGVYVRKDNKLVVLTSSLDACERIPKEIEGVEVICEVVGKIGVLQ